MNDDHFGKPGIWGTAHAGGEVIGDRDKMVQQRLQHRQDGGAPGGS